MDAAVWWALAALWVWTVPAVLIKGQLWSLVAALLLTLLALGWTIPALAWLLPVSAIVQLAISLRLVREIATTKRRMRRTLQLHPCPAVPPFISGMSALYLALVPALVITVLAICFPSSTPLAVAMSLIPAQTLVLLELRFEHYYWFFNRLRELRRAVVTGAQPAP